MMKRLFSVLVCLGLFVLVAPGNGFAQEDKIAQAAIDALKAQMRMAKGVEIKFVEKKESPIQDFYLVKLLMAYPDREVPVVIYVDKTGEKIIMGNLFVKGENVTRRETGETRLRKIDMEQLEIDKSPFRGSRDAKVTIVEFSNFQCPFCMRTWIKTKEILEKHSQNVRYVFKNYPQQGQAKSFELCEMAAAAAEASNDAFWEVHNFLFTEEGQTLAKGEKDAVKQKIEQILKEKGLDVAAFQSALETGKAKKRVEEDMAVGSKIRVPGTPTVVVNGNFVRGPLNERLLEQYLKK